MGGCAQFFITIKGPTVEACREIFNAALNASMQHGISMSQALTPPANPHPDW